MKKIWRWLLIVVVVLVALGAGYYFLRGQATDHVYTTAASIEKIVVAEQDVDVQIVGTSGDAPTRVQYATTKQTRYQFKQTGNQLVISKRVDRPRGSWLQLPDGAPDLKIQVPQAQLRQLHVKTSNSDIELKNLRLQQAQLISSDGDLELEHTSIAGKVTGKSSNGSVSLENVSFQQGHFVTSDDKIELEQVTFDQGHFQTSNGKINLENVTAKQALTLRTSNGHIKGNLLGRARDYTIDAKTSNASNNLKSRTGGRRQLKVHTSNGAIKLTIAKQAQMDDD